MIEAEKIYYEIGEKLAGAVISQMFGKPCLKVNGKAFACFFENEMVFKLTGETHAEAKSLTGTKLFDPSGKGRAMKEWVQIPFTHSEKWFDFALKAMEYVMSKS